MAVQVRRANVEDADLLSRLNADVQALHAQAMPWQFKTPGPETFPPSAAAGVLQRPAALVFIAEVADEPAGYAYAELLRQPETPYHHVREAIHLQHLSVRPQHRRAGIATALMDAVRAAGKEAGVDVITLDVYHFNATARAFFRSQGFEVYVERLWNR